MTPVPPNEQQIAAGAEVVIDALAKVLDFSSVPDVLRPLALQMAKKVVGDLIARSGINVLEIEGQVRTALELRTKLQGFLGHAN